ncbi:MAG: ABC transporter ATP-binding protein/permease [Deltaproteobacteria bacterium]|jgi:ATP-binding cassette subfamily B protein|nr:ABC transporter ATP-binding protein/permease [Deltaproteobacteria bacterium]
MLKTLRAIAGDLKTLRFLTLLQVIHAILTGLPTIILFLVIKELIKPAIDYHKLALYCAIIAITMIANVLLAMKLYVFNFVESYKITTKSRLRLADHLRLLSLGFFKRRDPGDISALMLQDMTKVEHIFSHFFTEMVASVVLPIMLGLGLLTQDPRLAAIMAAAAALAIPALIFGQRAITRLGRKQIESRNRSASRLLEYVQGINVFKAFSMTGQAFGRLDRALLTQKRDSVTLEVGTGIPITTFGLILNLGLVALLAIATALLFNGSLLLPIFVLFAVVGIKFFEPLVNFAIFLTEIRYMGLAAQRISAVFAEKPLKESDTPSGPTGHDIVFDRVSFAYNPGQPVISDLSLTIPQGAMTALVGPSGGGKTTMAGLMARFWDPDAGTISIGGCDIKNMQNDKLNSLFSFVFQDVYLFQDTILNNIKVGNRFASPEAITQAAKLAHCHDFIMDMEHGYLTMVGEGGATLSGGERQRISIARAILKNAPIVVLDEATASLDPENELSVQMAISALVKDKTLVVIAHRLKTVASANQIVVLERGRISELGTHDRLLAAKGPYFALWQERQKTGGWKIPGKATCPNP